jgi:antitoxin (DNA-binding transcriptional repressor) of toxin-antitoxin stability system
MKMESFTAEEFQSDFDNLMERVENGESFIITSDHGNAVIVPYNEIVESYGGTSTDEDFIKIHTDHEEAP